jgi:hypothetical protein
MRLILLSIIFELGSCGIPRPDTDLCVVNVGGGHQKCYNLKKDYDDEGNRDPSAKPTYKPVTKIEDLDKLICTDADGFASLKAYINSVKEEFKKCKEGK